MMCVGRRVQHVWEWEAFRNTSFVSEDIHVALVVMGSDMYVENLRQ